MIKIKVAFLEDRLLSSQSEQSDKFSKSPDWLEKSRPSLMVLVKGITKHTTSDVIITMGDPYTILYVKGHSNTARREDSC